MNRVLEKVRNLDRSNAEAIKEVLSAFFQQIGKNVKVDSYVWLRALENIINQYPKYCMSHRKTIEQYLTKYLDSRNYFLVIEAAKCAHVLQQVRPCQEKTATSKTSWREQMALLCNAAHSLIGAIFVDAIDIYKKGGYFQTLEQPLQAPNSPMASALSDITTVEFIDKSSGDKQNALCTRLQNILIFIQAMFVEIYPVAKPVRPQTVLDVLVRALSVSSGNAVKSGISDVAGIKNQALRTLDAIIVCLGSNLIPFSPLIFRMAMQTIRWSSENINEEFDKVRCQAYSTLSHWLTTLHCHKPDVNRSDGRGKCFEDELLTNVLNDITPTKHVVQLMMNSRPTKNLSKKAKRKMANSMLQESTLASHMPGDKSKTTGPTILNESVALAALECTETLLNVCGGFLKPTTHKLLQERIVLECYNMWQYSAARGALLCRVLEAARVGAPPSVPPPTAHCTRLYSSLAVHADPQISRFCSQALHNIRLHLHCSPPSLNFTAELPRSKETSLSNGDKNKVSQRNRAALETLLGPTRVAKNNIESGVTINDEPANKKARLEDAISISSRSSLEVTDDSCSDGVVIDIDITQSSPSGDIKENDVNVVIDEVQDENSSRPISPLVQSNIHELPTQLPVIVYGDSIDGKAIGSSPLSPKVSIDYSNISCSKVAHLETIEEDNLPSTGDTDDIIITCGQLVRDSQETNQNTKEIENECTVTVTHLTNAKPEDKSIENVVVASDVTSNTVGHDDITDKVKDIEIEVSVIDTDSKITNDDGMVTIEDMMADFVDEVNEEVVKSI